MYQNAQLLEKLQLVAGFVPVNMATAANNGDWVSLKNYRRCLAVLFKAAGAAGEDPVFTLRQATDVAGAGAKALNFTTVQSKVGADLQTIAQWTTTAQAAANTYTDLVSAESQALICVDIKAEDLDIKNGFDCVQLQIPDVGATAQVGCALYILMDPLEQDVPANMAGAIAN